MEFPLICNLGLHRQKNDAISPRCVDIAKFKDELEEPRVLTETTDYFVYSIKARQSFRIVPKRSSTVIAFKCHTQPISTASAVYLSNIVASSSAAEVCVWCIDEKEAVELARFDANVRVFCWVFRGNSPDLAVLRDNVVSYIKITTARDEQRIVVAEADLELVKRVTPQAKLLASNDKYIAIQYDDTRLITGTRSSVETPVWRPTDGNPITAMTYAATSQLAVGSNDSVSLFDVAAEPQPLMKFIVSGPIQLGSIAARGQLLVLACKGTNEVVAIHLGNRQAAVCALPGQVRDKSFTVSETADDAAAMLVDLGSVLKLCILDRTTPMTALEFQQRAADASPSKDNGAPRPPMGLPPQYQQAIAAQQPWPAVDVNPTPVFRNPALANVGSVNSVVENAIATIDASRSGLDRSLQTTKRMMAVAQTVIPQDHRRTMELALKKQVDQLSRQVDAVTLPNENDLLFLLEKISATISVGVASVVETEAINTLEPLLIEQLQRSAKRDNLGDLKAKLDAALSGATTELANRVEERIVHQTEQQVLSYIRQIQGEYTQTIAALQEIIKEQQEQLGEYQRAKLKDQIDRLKGAIQGITKKLQARPSTILAVPDQSPETLASIARACIESKDYRRGLQQILDLKMPKITVTMLTSLSDESQNEAFLADEGVPDQLWAQAALHLVAAASKENIVAVLWWLTVILTDKDAVASQVKDPVLEFAKKWREREGADPATDRQLKALLRVTANRASGPPRHTYAR